MTPSEQFLLKKISKAKGRIASAMHLSIKTHEE
jgi:hypothetical protein